MILGTYRKHERSQLNVQLYNRLALEVKEKMDNGNIGLECFAARLWDQREKMNLDLEELSYGMILYKSSRVFRQV
jgi:hypothetical protein